MTKNHLSRLAAPKSWPIKRKGIKWIVKPSAGAHGLNRCIPINIILKNILNHANTTKEVKKILNDKKVLVNNRVIKDHKFSIGIMDTISIPSTDEYYRVILDQNNKFILQKINKQDSLLKPNKIINKTPIKNKRIQINFYDGQNKIIDKDQYKVGDTVIFDLEKKEIKSHLKFEKSALIYLLKGKHVGTVGVLDEVINNKDNRPNKIIIKQGKEKFETLMDFAYVVDKKTILEK